jgi:aarF domain-containing kinase
MELLKGVKLTDAIVKQYTKLAQDRGLTFEEFKKEQLAKGPGPSEKQMSRYIILARCQTWVKNALIGCWNYGFGSLLRKPVKYVDWEEPLNIPAILNLLVEVHSYELFVNGAFNADPHPGNVMLLKDGRLGLVDYGQVGRLTKEDTSKYARIIIALANDERAEVARLLTEDLGYITKSKNIDDIWRFAAFYIDRDSDDVTEGKMPMTFMEHLDNIVPFSYVPPNWVMCVRLALILRSFGHAFGYPLSIANLQKPFALQVLEAQ